MRRRHTRYRKRFRCGHVGLGVTCHRCAQAKACREGRSIGSGVSYTVANKGREWSTQEWHHEAVRLERAS